jgi:hypothetical protein
VEQGAIAMLMTKERRPAFRTIEGWARSVLIEAGAIHECEEHGWAKDRADPHARDRALDTARQIRRRASRRRRRLSRSRKCWIRSATPVRNARPAGHFNARLVRDIAHCPLL